MLATTPILAHLAALSDDTGVIQHAVYDVPNRGTGYCTDDVSRAFIAVLAKLQLEPLDQTATALASTYLAFLFDAQMHDGRFHNFMSFQRTWLDEVGTQDCFGRAVWSLGYGMRYAPRESWRELCAAMLSRALPAVNELQYLRSQAYAILGLSLAAQSELAGRLQVQAAVVRLARSVHNAYIENSDTDWQWFENCMTYDNARLPQALVQAGLILGDGDLAAVGLRTLSFYASVVMEAGTFVPIGNDGWYPRGGRRARFGQQPLETAALVDAALVAYEATSDRAHLALADGAFTWFHGHNSSGVIMVSAGGCKDGIDEGGVNSNMGAESTIAYLAAAFALHLAGRSP